jgi:DNA-binding NarL/FixJ family response regulator
LSGRVAESRTPSRMVGTVEAHRANICSKLSLQGANSLLVYAMEHRDELNCLA